MKMLKELEKSKKNRILGLLLCTLALLLLISLISYHRSDYSGSTFSDEIQNRGGLAGAFIGYWLVAGMGLCSIFVPFGLIFWGANRFLGKSVHALRRFGIIAIFFIISIMTLVSLFHARDDFATLGMTFGGALGHYLAKGLVHLVGGLVAFTITISLIVTGLMIVVPGALTKGVHLFLGLFSKDTLEKFKKEKAPSKTKATVLDNPPALKAEKKDGFVKSILHIKKKDDKKTEPVLPEIAPVKASDEIPPDLFEEPPVKPVTTTTRIKGIRTPGAKGDYRLPPIDLLDDPPSGGPIIDESYFRKTAEALRHTLLTFGVEIESGEVNILPGPIITRFEFKPASGIKVSQILNLADDLALAMQAERIRIVAPIPGKPAVGIEIPNRVKRDIYIKEVIASPAFTDSDARLVLALGKTISGEPFVADLARMPHLLLAGSTGSGKSVCLNCLLTSLIFRLHPDEIRFILIDPKRLELSVYDGLPHLEKPVVTEMKDAEKMLADAVIEMEERYRILARAGVRNIAEYNAREKELLPYLVIVVDELADLMMSGLNRVETLITRLAQMARAVGIHLILATQRPSVDVITGLIKANFSTRIAFQTASKVDSRTILDANGAEKLLGRGDMLFSTPGLAEPIRIHGAYISGEETDRLVEFISQQEYRTKAIETFEKSETDTIPGFDPASDPLFKEAVELVIKHKQGSVSLLQRRLGVGYQRAARLIDQLEQAGIVGPYDGSKAREVLVDETYLESREYK
ncbi:MAG TPA: DNA translocase FtsK [candidate division Zixibacteria bacterium]|nr:DNA translocase FtsK [candidate division Zixibacteria bacterium]HBZ01779.1 DNA translocase FtsK [candidate division Zixibacteria bacterium]